jgi:hypothetical protein
MEHNRARNGEDVAWADLILLTGFGGTKLLVHRCCRPTVIIANALVL